MEEQMLLQMKASGLYYTLLDEGYTHDQILGMCCY